MAYERTVSGVSQRYQMVLDAWLAHIRACGEMGHDDLQEGEFWRGGDEMWPEWVSVEAVAMLVTQHSDIRMSKAVTGRWLKSFDIPHKDVEITKVLRGGANTQSTTRRMYDVSSWRYGTIY